MQQKLRAGATLGFFFWQSLAYAQVPTPAEAAKTPGAPESHTVQSGDTLWDLSARYLQNPWYWPKVWSYNPQISNPHFIYPGDQIRLQPGGEALPTHVEVSSQREMPAEGAEAAASSTSAPAPVANEGPAPLSDEMIPRGDQVQVSGDRPLSYQGKRGMIVQNLQLVTEKELQESGELANAFEDKQLLSTYDLVYIRYNKDQTPPAVGAPIIFYRKVQDVTHPVTGDDYVMTMITGTGEVVAAAVDPTARKEDGSELVSARITRVIGEPVERGQLVAQPTGPITFELTETANTQKLDGVIMTGEYHSHKLLGQFHYVFVDRGKKDGVQNGNSFVVIRDKDIFKEDQAIPKQVVGKLVVVDVKDNTSLALVVQSLRDIAKGDRVEMR